MFGLPPHVLLVSTKNKYGSEYNAAVVGYKHGVDAACARMHLDSEDCLRSGHVSVSFCAGHHHDVTDDMDDELDDELSECDAHEDGTLDSLDDDMDFDDDL